MYMRGCPHGDVTLGGLEQIGNEGKLQSFLLHKSIYIYRNQEICSSNFLSCKIFSMALGGLTV